VLVLLQALPVLFLIAIGVFGALAGAAWLRLLSTLFQGSAAAAALSGIAVLAALALVEVVVRQFQRLRRPRWLGTPQVMAYARRVRPEDLGGAGWALGRLAALGIPTARCLLATSALGLRLLAAGAVARDKGNPARALPWGARRQLRRFLAGCRGADIRIRPSFVFEDARATHAGVFPMVIASSRDLDAVVAAMLRVLESREADRARAYRKRFELTASLSTALVLEVVVDADVRGSVVSRGLEGRMDRALMEYTRRRSPRRVVHYDFVVGAA
jgi:hypothetical protein